MTLSATSGSLAVTVPTVVEFSARLKLSLDVIVGGSLTSVTANSTCADSILPPAVQTAPVAAQSVVTGRTTVTSAWAAGSRVMSQPWLLPGTSRDAPVTVPPVTSNVSSRSVLKPISTFSLKRSWKVKAVCPSWVAGEPLTAAVSGSFTSVTVTVRFWVAVRARAPVPPVAVTVSA